MFKGYYRRRFPEILSTFLSSADGLGDIAVRKALRKRGLTIPKALADYYSVAGHHKVNDQHNCLLPIEQLRWEGEALVFMEENQCVAFWGIQRADVNAGNPIVWQAPNAEQLQWFEEPFRVSQFLMAMWRWQRTGIVEKPERTKITR